MPMNAGVFVTEFGSSPQSAHSKLANIIAEQDDHLTGSTFWVWKETGGGWGLFDGPRKGAPAGTPNGDLRQDYVAQLSRIVPLATVGTLNFFHYNSFLNTSRIFAMEATAPVVESNELAVADSLVYVPSHVQLANREVEVFGSAKLAGIDMQPDKSHVLQIAVIRNGGKYQVVISSTEYN